MRFNLGFTPLYLRDAWTDWDEILRVYKLQLKLVRRHIFNFRFGGQPEVGLFFVNRKLEISRPEVETYLDG